MPKLVWLNGTISPLESATTSVADHAHLYGDGLFEGIRIYGGKVFKLDEHLERLYHGTTFLDYEMKITKADLRATLLDVCRQAEIADGYILLNVTRGTGLGLDPKNIDRTPNVMIMVSTLALYPEEAYELGLNVITCSYRVIPADALDPRLKCIGRYASNILAKAEAMDAAAVAPYRARAEANARRVASISAYEGGRGGEAWTASLRGPIHRGPGAGCQRPRRPRPSRSPSPQRPPHRARR